MKTQNKKIPVRLIFAAGLSLGAVKALAQENPYEEYYDIYSPPTSLWIQNEEQQNMLLFFKDNGLIEREETGIYYIDQEALFAFIVREQALISAEFESNSIEVALEEAFGMDINITKVPPFRVYVGSQDWSVPIGESEDGNPIANEPKVEKDWDNNIEFEEEKLKIDPEKIKELENGPAINNGQQQKLDVENDQNHLFISTNHWAWSL